MTSLTSTTDRPRSNRRLQIALLILLTAILAIGAVPGYLAGSWKWQNPPAVKTLGELKNVRKHGIEIPGWRTTEQKSIVLGEHPWSIQTIENNQKETATIFLFTQNGPKDQPQVEWDEINGVQRWKHDSQSSQSFTENNRTIHTRLIRAWTPNRTYAVMQWYAWSDGGHSEPSHWFFADRLAQVQGKRQPWVAVSILLPMEPLDDVNKYRDRITALAQSVHQRLTQTALAAQTP